MVAPAQTGTRLSKRADQDLRIAWAAVASWPVAFVVAMVVGEGLISMMGYESGADGAVPIGPALLAGIPALLVLVTPGVAAMLYGYRGYRAGRAAAKLPAWIGGAVATAMVVVNLLAFVLGR